MTRTWAATAAAVAAAIGMFLAGCVPAEDPGDCTRRRAVPAMTGLVSDHAGPAAASTPRPTPNPRPGPHAHDCG